MKSQTMLPVAPPSGGPGMESVPQLIAATAHTLPEQRHALLNVYESFVASTSGADAVRES